MIMTQQRFEPSKALRQYKEELEGYISLTDEQTRDLFRRIRENQNKEHTAELKKQIAQGYFSFVIDVAETFTDIELLVVDYIQEGNIALLEGIEEYDPRLEESFLEYITPRVQAAIQAYLVENPIPAEFVDPLSNMIQPPKKDEKK